MLARPPLLKTSCGGQSNNYFFKPYCNNLQVGLRLLKPYPKTSKYRTKAYETVSKIIYNIHGIPEISRCYNYIL